MTEDYIDDKNSDLYDPQSASDELMTMEEVEKLMSVSRSTIHNWRKKGLLPAYQIGNTRKVRFKRSEVLAFAANSTVLTRI